jgi:PIN domain nuclease of toxin-antitoxin system
VTLLDAYALVALVGDEPAAAEVEDLLRTADPAITSINLAEAVDVLHRIHGLADEAVRAAVWPLVGAPLVVVRPTEYHAWDAADLRRRYYHRRLRPLSLADCFLLAGAAGDDRIATADPAVAEAAREEGISLVALPDTSGKRP